MIDLKRFALDGGLSFDGKHMLAHGSYRGYPVIVQYQQQNRRVVLVVSVQADEAQAAALTDYLAQLGANDTKAGVFASYSGHTVTAGMKQSSYSKKDHGATVALFDNILAYCASNRLAPCCAVCGGTTELGIYSTLNSYQSLCPACFEKEKCDLAAAQQEIHSKPTNYAAGLLGAVLGALPGVALWFAIGELGKIAAISSLVVMLGSIYGYKKLGGGKLNAGGVAISVAVAVGMLFLAEYGSLSYDIYKAYKDQYDITYQEVFRKLPVLLKDNPELWQGFVSDLVIGYIFLIATAASSVYHSFKDANLKCEMKKLN